MKRAAGTFCICIGIGMFFSGCASPANPSAMIPTVIAPAPHHTAGSLNVAVTGGHQTSSVGASQISNDDFAKALVASIDQTKIFSSVGSGQSSRYQLNAYIAKLTQPLMGFSMTVTMEVGYTLVDRESGHPIWQKEISSQHTAAASDAFAGVKRLQLATEGAAKQNIESLVRELFQLSF